MLKINNLNAFGRKSVISSPPANTGEAEFDVVGATYFAVAPAGYTYSSEQTTNYSTRKYNSLFAAEAALAISPTTPQIINIIGDWSATSDTTPVNFDGTTPTATNYTLVRTIGIARHPGYYTTAAYRIINTINANSAIILSDPFITVRGLILVSGYTGGSQGGLNFASGASTSCVADGCVIVRQNITSTTNYGISHNTSSVTPTIRNCVVVGYNVGMRNGHATAGGFNCDNNTIINCTTGLVTTSAGNFLARNNIISGSTTAAASGTFTAGSDYNATDRATMGYTVNGSGNIHDRVSQTFTFVNAGASDYHLSSSDTGAKDVGQDLSATFTRDIDYVIRTAPWSIGADEP